MKNYPLVSVVIPYYKKKFFFEKTISSILNQSYKNFEIILIYDDNNLEELDFLKNIKKKFKNVRLIINKKNLGPGLSRNKGILLSKGTYIAFCDADDIWKKNKLNLQIEFMKKHHLNFSHTSYFVIDREGKKIGKFKTKSKMEYRDLLKSCDIGLSTVIVKKNLLRKNLFCNLQTKEDFYLWLQIIKKEKKIFSVNKYLSYWRYLENSLSSSISQKLLDAFRLYYNYEKKNFFTSVYYVLRLSYYAFIKKLNIYKTHG
ncbi:glycosyltransferase family 2 protein [Candidatus Pelagibacter sp.]|uniref:glycosyltransferase family 2 protein n=1 Tax=Candidatus Pelagibacter sp. TaxID=2024849 RepID=UPI003F84C270